jgi:nitrite reductase/ring-hydroxylating ferredoxin subunit
MKAHKYILILMVSVVLIGTDGCKKKNDQVPLVPVDLFINVNEPQFFDLSSVTGWVYVTGGSEGIIIYRNNTDEFSAYDRHAPINIEDECQIKVNDDNITIEDPCTGSRWLIIDGSLIEGPAIQGLESYNATFVDPVLHVYN